MNGSFYFEKGISKNFHYKNLSAGEKCVFDLLLDMIIKAKYFQNTIFCIDEPEAHMHTRLQSKVLKELYGLIPENSQLWISTHSIGMLKQATDIEKSFPNSVVFLDFDDRDFDLPVSITPAAINKTLWDRFFDLAFDDFSNLIAPKNIILCEGDANGKKHKNFDARVYEKIFETEHPDCKFISIGSFNDILRSNNLANTIISNIVKSPNITKFVDRDNRNEQELLDLQEEGIRTTKRRHIECYLLDDEIIGKLCTSVGKDELLEECLRAKAEALQSSKSRGNPADDIKSASGGIFNALKTILSLINCGSDACSFLRDTMAPLVTKETAVYKELHSEIFESLAQPKP